MLGRYGQAKVNMKGVALDPELVEQIGEAGANVVKVMELFIEELFTKVARKMPGRL
jgi:hypothetical protein